MGVCHKVVGQQFGKQRNLCHSVAFKVPFIRDLAELRVSMYQYNS
jgi:hypothetical protein